MRLTSFSSNSVALSCSRVGLEAAQAWNSRTKSSRALFISGEVATVRLCRRWLGWFAYSAGTRHLVSLLSQKAEPQWRCDQRAGISLRRCRWDFVVLTWSILEGRTRGNGVDNHVGLFGISLGNKQTANTTTIDPGLVHETGRRSILGRQVTGTVAFPSTLSDWGLSR